MRRDRWRRGRRSWLSPVDVRRTAKHLSIFEKFEHPQKQRSRAATLLKSISSPASFGDYSLRRQAGQVKRIDGRGKSVSAMYALDCHNLPMSNGIRTQLLGLMPFAGKVIIPG
jgi:hypothetical protein